MKKLSAFILPLAFSLPLLAPAEAHAGRYLANGIDVSVSQGQYLKLSFDKIAGKSYSICAIPSTGDPDIYTHYISWATKTFYQFRSPDPGPDCVEFDASQSGQYFYSIYAYTSTTFHYFVYEE